MGRELLGSRLGGKGTDGVHVNWELLGSRLGGKGTVGEQVRWEGN